MSCWVKRGNNDSTTDSDCIISSSDTATVLLTHDMIRIREDKLNFYTDSGATGATNNYFSTRLLRDVSAWYHIVVQFDKVQWNSQGLYKWKFRGNSVMEHWYKWQIDQIIIDIISEEEEMQTTGL